MEKYIKKFSEITMKDIAEVGGKNASLGEMVNTLVPKGILVPDGFAVTVAAYKYFINQNGLGEPLAMLMQSLDRKTYSNLDDVGRQARTLILRSPVPNDLKMAITDEYDYLFDNDEPAVAVRSSATAEDLPNASFAGQHESYLNIRGHMALVDAVKRCFASLYTGRAIKYREDKGFAHDKVFLSVGVQAMVRSDLGCSGVGFTLEPESGFRDVVHIAGVWGLGENIVQGTDTPDEFLVFKPMLKKGLQAVIQKNLGSKSKMMVYADEDDDRESTVNRDTPADLREKFVLTEKEVEKLGHWGLILEDHYGKPMDFEWAKDGLNHQLYLIQARPETVHSQKKKIQLETYTLTQKGTILTKGEAVGSKIASGTARIIFSPDEMEKLKPGDILITDTTSPDWDPILKMAGGIVTNKGGRTSHAAIIARELGAAAIVGTENATSVIRDGDEVTIDCSEGKTGKIYRGRLQWKESITDYDDIRIPESPKPELIIADPEKAFELSFFPNYGVGLLRLEFIINNSVQIHPMALVRFDKVTDTADRAKIEEMTKHYPDKEAYFVDKLSQGVATIAAAFYPKEVIV
ncbi:MAG TPA: phosphoenolpyruvate synthase, partial [Mucilaginibacter sp.]|nr:phosphoenolpyruvate synthase [Mucilaginibacter sp.]